MTEFRRILCPVDFSDTTPAAMGPALALAGAYGAELFVIHVLDFPHETIALERYYLEIEDEANRRLTELTRGMGSDEMRVHSAVLRGTPYERIVRFAGEQNIDLIVMGTHRRGGIDRLVAGSVAERTARLADCPVLTVPPTESVPENYLPQRVLFATDFSDYSDSALPVAISIASRFGARLTLVHVITLAERGEYGEGWRFPTIPPEVEQQHLAEAEAGLGERGALVGTDLTVDTHLIRGTHPAIEIAEYAEGRADLIVVASHGHSAFSRALLGSTTEKLMRYSKVPVLAVRPRES